MSESADVTSTSLPVQSRAKKISKGIFWTFFFLFFLVLFTVSKLPETKVTTLIQGYLQVGIDPYGVYITDHGREFSVFNGFRYRLIQPTFELSDQTRIELDEVTVAPTLLSLLKGQPGATISITQGNSHIIINGSGRGDKINANVTLDQVDVGKFGVLAYAAGLKGTGIITGDIHIDGALSDLTSLTGSVALKLSKIHLDEQNLMGFNLPAMNVSEGVIDVPLEHGKLQMKNVHLGKPGSSDDIQVVVTGDVTLNKFVNASALNLRAVLGLSDKVKQSLALLDSIMGSAKTPDGKYAYKLTGSLGGPFPIPDPNGK
jgi:type II secretion system protein N